MRRFKNILIVVLAIGAISNIFSQTADDDGEMIRVDTQLIDVPIVVVDKVGRPILNLKQSNFVIYEDGRKQNISDFSTTSAPFEIALLLDTSGSTRSDLQIIQRAAESFVNSLRTGDRVSVIAYRSNKVDGGERAISEVLSVLTEDKAQLRTSLNQVKTSNGTPYYDSLIQIIEKVFDKKPEEKFRGRRALVALTDGVDSNSGIEFDVVRKQLANAGFINYFIKVDTQEYFENKILGDCQSSLWFSKAQIRRYYNKFYPQPNFEKAYDFCQIGEFERMDISKKLYRMADVEMTDLAQMSGGKVFPISNLQSAKEAFDKVAQEIGTKYSIGYYSDNDARNGAFRKIRVELKGLPAGATVRTRDGYTAPPK